MPITFEWNSKKASENTHKHGVSFEEAATCFGDLISRVIHDPDHSVDEDRYALLGMSAQSRLLVVVHTERGENIRIISVRLANRRETALYLQSH
jgi:uncharacterized DUF497 family protein